MTPVLEHALSIVGLVVVTCWFITLGIAAVLWVREDLRQHRARKRAEQLFVPLDWSDPGNPSIGLFDDDPMDPAPDRFRELEW